MAAPTSWEVKEESLDNGMDAALSWIAPSSGRLYGHPCSPARRHTFLKVVAHSPSDSAALSRGRCIMLSRIERSTKTARLRAAPFAGVPVPSAARKLSGVLPAETVLEPSRVEEDLRSAVEHEAALESPAESPKEYSWAAAEHDAARRRTAESSSPVVVNQSWAGVVARSTSAANGSALAGSLNMVDDASSQLVSAIVSAETLCDRQCAVQC
mmetsp:Transcript_54125/g.128577  ORF Transcript_54125/g.128577 Transcript_54125/m.128577 type:complete len:212 (-) Transcript_54125:148-783(-)